MDIVTEIAKKAKAAASGIAAASTARKNRLLESIAGSLIKNSGAIIAENKKDLELCQKKQISESLRIRD